MSGGHWQYAGARLAMECENIALDEDVACRWPLVAGAFDAFGEWAVGTEHDMDWDLSGDSAISLPGSYDPSPEADARFDRLSFDRLLVALLKMAPDDLFPRGKWATIQAIQGRSERATGVEPGRQNARRRSSEHVERMMEAGWPSLGLPTAECPW